MTDNSTLMRRGLMFVLSSPSGAGKTTISRTLLKGNDNLIVSTSVTTRPRRAGEVSGQDYYFVDHTAFDEMVKNGDLLEHARVHDHYYGTPRQPVMNALAAGRDVIFDIDWQGTQQLAEIAREDLVTVFILPPSSVELERRLRTRARDPEDVIRKRLAKAAEEMSHYSEYDYVIVNQDIDKALAQAQTILNAEHLKRHRMIGVSDFVRGLMQGL
jgi:guanylate kinase